MSEESVARNVGNNVFPWLPASGLQRLLHLKAHNNPNLRHFHPPELFPRIQVTSRLSHHTQQCYYYQRIVVSFHIFLT